MFKEEDMCLFASCIIVVSITEIYFIKVTRKLCFIFLNSAPVETSKTSNIFTII